MSQSLKFFRCLPAIIHINVKGQYGLNHNKRNIWFFDSYNISKFYQNLHHSKTYPNICICPVDCKCDVMCKGSISRKQLILLKQLNNFNFYEVIRNSDIALINCQPIEISKPHLLISCLVDRTIHPDFLVTFVNRNSSEPVYRKSNGKYALDGTEVIFIE